MRSQSIPYAYAYATHQIGMPYSVPGRISYRYKAMDFVARVSSTTRILVVLPCDAEPFDFAYQVQLYEYMYGT